jgi:hypothetical protein
MDSFLFYFTVKNKLNICQMKYPKQESDKKDPDEGKDLVIGHESQVYPLIDHTSFFTVTVTFLNSI